MYTVMDFLVMVLIILKHYDIFGAWRFMLLAIVYLAGKWLMFRDNIMSWIDLIIAFYMILMILGASWFITWIAVIYLLQKIIFAVILTSILSGTSSSLGIFLMFETNAPI